MTFRKKILVLSDWFLPGYKAGGPIRSIAYLVEHLSNDFDFAVVTRDRDLGSQVSYHNVKLGAWQRVGNASVFYLAPHENILTGIAKIMRDMPYTTVYLNSFFSFYFAIWPLVLHRIKLVPQVRYVIAPRGQFSKGALTIRCPKKKTYIRLACFISLFRDVIWHATSEQEAEDIKRIFGNNVKIILATNLPPKVPLGCFLSPRRKRSGFVKLVLLGRISPMKNVDGALKILRGCAAQIEFNIYGPKEDLEYWSRCQEIIATLPNNIAVSFRGQVEHEEVKHVFSENDFLFLPSLGENFGHVIFEGLASGCPVIISDRTPWRDLEIQGIGWDIPLTQPERFQEVIEMCAAMSDREYDNMSRRAHLFVSRAFTGNKAIKSSRDLFE